MCDSITPLLPEHPAAFDAYVLMSAKARVVTGWTERGTVRTANVYDYTRVPAGAMRFPTREEAVLYARAHGLAAWYAPHEAHYGDDGWNIGEPPGDSPTRKTAREAVEMATKLREARA